MCNFTYISTKFLQKEKACFMGCKFNIQTNRNINTLYNQALKEMPKYNVSFDGDETGGNFTLKMWGNNFNGMFKVIGNVVYWEIFKKPGFISCKIIESFLRNYLS